MTFIEMDIGCILVNLFSLPLLTLVSLIESNNQPEILKMREYEEKKTYFNQYFHLKRTFLGYLLSGEIKTFLTSKILIAVHIKNKNHARGSF